MKSRIFLKNLRPSFPSRTNMRTRKPKGKWISSCFWPRSMCIMPCPRPRGLKTIQSMASPNFPTWHTKSLLPIMLVCCCRYYLIKPIAHLGIVALIVLYRLHSSNVTTIPSTCCGDGWCQTCKSSIGSFWNWSHQTWRPIDPTTGCSRQGSSSLEW